MKIKLLSYTRLNPVLTPITTAHASDLSTLWQANSTDAEKIIEYAARTCYRSNQRMGSAPGFIADCVARGHEDVIEHAWATFGINGDWNNQAWQWSRANRYLEISRHYDYDSIVSGNFRVWLNLLSLDYCEQIQPYLQAIAPLVFGDATETVDVTLPASQIKAPVSVENAPLRVTLLGYSHPGLGGQHGSATFLFEGISRTCTHQLVRHRLGSFSMESARYVSLEKGGWSAIIPPSINASPAALAVMQDAWAFAESAYAKLRALGIRAEDARFLLPGAAQTRIVTTMNFAGWRHFFELRALDKAAQWEIRGMAQIALGMLAQVAPDVFSDQMAKYRERFLDEQKTDAVGQSQRPAA